MMWTGEENPTFKPKNIETKLMWIFFVSSALCFAYALWGFGYLDAVSKDMAEPLLMGEHALNYPGVVFLWQLGIREPATPTSMIMALCAPFLFGAIRAFVMIWHLTNKHRMHTHKKD